MHYIFNLLRSIVIYDKKIYLGICQRGFGHGSSPQSRKSGIYCRGVAVAISGAGGSCRVYAGTVAAYFQVR